MAQALPEVFAILVELVGEVDIEAAASGALVDVTGEEVIAGGAELLSGTGAEGEIVMKPIFEDASLASGDLVGPGELGNVTKGQLHALWQDAKTFARWTGREIMKGALFEAGIEAVEALLVKSPSPDPDTSDLEHILGSVRLSLKTLTQITIEWRRWCVKQFSHRNDYGVIRIDDTLLLRFEIFRNKLGDLSLYMQKTLVPLLDQLHKSIDNANMGGLKAATKTYADMILASSKEIKHKESLMMHAGLKDHEEEIQKARDILN